MVVDLEYYNRFPAILKDALISGKVNFPSSIKREYPGLTVYRGVRYSMEKTTIDKSDFLSKMELRRKNPMIVAFEDQIASYSCSCFLNIDQIRIQAKFPRKKQAIARGIIKNEFGPIDINEDTSHVDLYLYDNVDPSSEFKVVEKWEENG